LFYWWPVWLVGFVLSGLTWFEGTRLAVVPEGTKVRAVGEQVYQLTVPDRPSAALVQAQEATRRGGDAFPVGISGNRNVGMVYFVVVLVVLLGANAPLRGLASVVAMLALVTLTLVLAYLDVWGWILERLGGLHIQISVAGYLVPSVVLLVLWLGTVFGLDQVRFVRFNPGQITVHQEIGAGREVYETSRVTFQKRRSDLFRHWILGLGSGDLVIQIPNLGTEIVLPNVLFVDAKVRRIANLIGTQEVTTS
jgi:hypothetical protein